MQKGFQSFISRKQYSGGLARGATCCFAMHRIPESNLTLSPEWAILPSVRAIGIEADHLSLTKFKSFLDPNFKMIKSILSTWIQDLKIPRIQFNPNVVQPSHLGDFEPFSFSRFPALSKPNDLSRHVKPGASELGIHTFEATDNPISLDNSVEIPTHPVPPIAEARTVLASLKDHPDRINPLAVRSVSAARLQRMTWSEHDDNGFFVVKEQMHQAALQRLGPSFQEEDNNKLSAKVLFKSEVFKFERISKDEWNPRTDPPGSEYLTAASRWVVRFQFRKPAKLYIIVGIFSVEGLSRMTASERAETGGPSIRGQAGESRDKWDQAERERPTAFDIPAKLVVGIQCWELARTENGMLELVENR